MNKVMVIKDGLENLGVLKPGGHASVYKVRRKDGSITAVKVLPASIDDKNPGDHNFIHFQNELQKLEGLNKIASPNLVKFLSAGVTATGSFPFIEMELINGPELEELTEPVLKPVLRISQVIKVASHIAAALAHCHRAGLKHGSITSSSIKLNPGNDNYVLVDFGFGLLAEEGQRASLLSSSNIEYTAPEQNEAELFFQTDIYSFGIVLYKLLAGQVPFKRRAPDEGGRNDVMIAHLRQPPRDVMQLRWQALPHTWQKDKKEFELKVPEWLLLMIERCLQKDPKARFADGTALLQFIEQHSGDSKLSSALTADPGPITEVTPPVHTEPVAKVPPSQQQPENETASVRVPPTPATPVSPAKPVENIAPVEEFKRNTIEPAQPITVEAIQATPVNKVPPRPYVKDDSTDLVTERKIRKLPNAKREPRTISRLGVILSLIGVSILAASIYYFLAKDSAGNPDPSTTVVIDPEDSATEPSERITDERGTESINPSVDPRVVRREPQKNSGAKTSPPVGATGAANSSRRGPVEDTIIRQKMVKETVTPVAARSSTDARYRVKSRAYFHNEPDESTRRNAFIVHWNKAILSPLNVENDFVYIVFTNHLGQTSKGWLRLQDLVKVED